MTVCRIVEWRTGGIKIVSFDISISIFGLAFLMLDVCRWERDGRGVQALRNITVITK